MFYFIFSWVGRYSIQPQISFRNFVPILKKSSGGTRLPRVELSEMGPSVQFTLRRSRFAKDDLLKQAMIKSNTNAKVYIYYI